MADVYLARRRAAAGVEKRMVIKRIRKELAADPRFVRLFVKEARLSVELAHANIVPVFDFGRAGDELFLAMEHVDGRDLAAALCASRERGERLDPVLVAHIGAEACEALDYAHRRRDAEGRPLGIVHRDVTPRNVLLSFSGEVKLVDFGVASLADEEHGRVRGTPAYMAPEQARGEPVDPRADLYALGLVLHEAVTGERARAGPDALEQARAGTVPPLADDVPARLRGAIERATRPRPEERFADAREMQRELGQVVVEARAADPSRPAPAHALALWLASLAEASAPLVDEPVSPEAAPAVTFLEDGEEAVAGDVTVRSIAETVGDDQPPPPAPSPARWPWALAAAAVGVVAGTLALSDRRDEGPPAPAAAGGAASAGVREAEPPASDAAPPAPDASPPAAVAPVGAAPPRATPRPAAASERDPRRARLFPVDINSRPWARVFIDDRYVDDTPFRAELRAGTHRLRFENPVDGSSKTITIDVPRERPVVEDLASP
jgi:serine/threonine protein kinase